MYLKMNIQTELQKIHHQYGVSEKANYEIEKLFNKAIKEAVDESLDKPIIINKNHWLLKDDLEFAIALQQENRLDAVKWLCEKAKGYSLTPLKDAKDILDAYL